MTIQQTIESLTKGLPHDDATELRALIQAWPMHDQELQQLLESNTSEILQMFQQPQLLSAPESSTHEQPPLRTPLPNLPNFVPLANLN